jgi:hypothetical protein
MLHDARQSSPERAGEGEGPRLRIAIASRDGKSLNAHFGSAEKFMVYDVTPQQHELVQAIEITQVSDESGDHKVESEDKNGGQDPRSEDTPDQDRRPRVHRLGALAREDLHDKRSAAMAPQGARRDVGAVDELPRRGRVSRRRCGESYRPMSRTEHP